MNKVIAIPLIVVAFLAVLFGTSLISAKNAGNSAEVRIHAMYENNENIFAQYGQKVAEAVGVTEIAKNDMAELLTGSLEARYGADGSQASVSMITEAFPGLDAGVYTQIQRIVESGRNDFTVAQTQLTDAKRNYVDQLGSFPRGAFLNMVGYPRLNIGYPVGSQDDYPIISTQRAAATFETGTECGNALTAARGTDDC